MMNIESYSLDRSVNFVRLIERIRECLREREFSMEHRKIYSINHFIEHLKRSIQDNPFITRALFRFYQMINNISVRKNRKPFSHDGNRHFHQEIFLQQCHLIMINRR